MICLLLGDPRAIIIESEQTSGLGATNGSPEPRGRRLLARLVVGPLCCLGIKKGAISLAVSGPAAVGSLRQTCIADTRGPNPEQTSAAEVELSNNADIYFVLLGLPAGPRPPDHYTLLGLPPLTDSPRQINAAVERQMAKLTPLLLGPRGRRVQRMIGEVLQARDVLSSERRKRAYDEELIRGVPEPDATAETREIELPKDAAPAGQIFRGPPGASLALGQSAELTEISPVAPLPDVDSLLPPVAVEPTAPPMSPPVAPPIAARANERRVATPARDPSLSEMALDILQPRDADEDVEAPEDDLGLPELAVAPAAGPVIASLALPDGEATSPTPLPEFKPYNDPIDSQLPTPAIAEQTTWSPSLPAPTSRGVGVNSGRRDSSQGLVTVMAAVVGGAAIVACLGFIANERHNARMAEVAVAATNGHAESRSAEKGTKAPRASSTTPKRNPSPETKQPTQPGPRSTAPTAPPMPPSKSMPTAETASTEPPKASAAPAPTADAPAPSQPSPITNPASDTSPSAPPAADPKEAKAVAEALTKARTAMSKRDVEGAGKEIDLALVETSAVDLVAKIENEKALHHYVDGFWGAVRDRIAGLQGGEELPVGKQVIVVVERRGDRIIIRDRGANKTYGVRDMPAPLAAALAQSWLKKDDPNSAVFVGAFWSVDAKGDAKRGRQILEDAKKNGSEAAAGVLEALGPAE